MSQQEDRELGREFAEHMDPGSASGFDRFASFTADAAKAVGDSLGNLAGSLTGKSLEDRIQEYSEVYGEILLHLNDRMDGLEKRQSSLEDARLSADIINRLKEMRKQDPEFFTVEGQQQIRSQARIARILSILAFFASLAALFSVIFKV